MKSSNSMFWLFGAFSLGSLVGIVISSISQNQVEEPVNRLNLIVETTLILLILCIIIGGILIAK